MLLLVSRIALKTQRRAIFMSFLLMTVAFTMLYGGHPGVTLASAAIFAGLFLQLLVRFGVFALIAAFLTKYLTEQFPLTYDTTHWCFGHGMFAMALLAAIAVYGFYASQENRRVISTSAIRAI